MTEYVAAVVLAVNGVVVATPLVLVVVESVSVPLRKVPLAPLAGAVNVTVVPPTSTGFPCESSIVALRGFVKAVPTVVNWLPPPVTTSCDGAPATIVYVGLLATGVGSLEVLTLME
jgi:hypothetical protein